MARYKVEEILKILFDLPKIFAASHFMPTTIYYKVLSTPEPGEPFRKNPECLCMALQYDGYKWTVVIEEAPLGS